jgi:hypothetical protein
MVYLSFLESVDFFYPYNDTAIHVRFITSSPIILANIYKKHFDAFIENIIFINEIKFLNTSHHWLVAS